jgi:hypothetical protein
MVGRTLGSKQNIEGETRLLAFSVAEACAWRLPEAAAFFG